MNLDSCTFCHIATGDLPAHIVAESPRTLAFLDSRPIRPGHVQIIPREHYEYFDDLPEELAAEIVLLGQRISTALKEVVGAPRVGFAFTGADVPHAHAHVVPLHEEGDLTSRRYIGESEVTWQELPEPPVEEQLALPSAISDILLGRQGL